MLGLMGFSDSLPLCVTIIDIVCMFINWANKDACLLAAAAAAAKKFGYVMVPIGRLYKN